jgi:hypothetical protein
MSVRSAIGLLLNDGFKMSHRLIVRCQIARTFEDEGELDYAKQILHAVASEVPDRFRERYEREIDKP